MNRFILILVAIFVCATANASTSCENIQKKSDKEQVYLDKSQNIFEVISKGRLYFNSAPSKECEIKGVFLVPGDKIIGYTEYNGFMYAAYFKQNGDSVDGWLNISQLRNTGLSNGPSGDEQMIFNMIPDILSRNKLTSLEKECLTFDLNDKDSKYYTVIISRANDKKCLSDDELPFTVLVKKKTLEVYSNQGGKSDEFRELKTAIPTE